MCRIDMSENYSFSIGQIKKPPEKNIERVIQKRKNERTMKKDS